MYGMIHRAVRDMVIDQDGPDQWRRVLERSGVRDEDFISTRVYPDEKMGAIIGAIAELSGVSPADALHRFGEYFIPFAYRSRYSQILNFTGENLVAVLSDLDRLHIEVGRAMPGVRTPTFTVISVDGRDIRLAYRSTRQGLEPFVAGLLRGLVDHFGGGGSIEILSGANDGANFLIRLDD
jgi:hypothetical protein